MTTVVVVKVGVMKSVENCDGAGVDEDDDECNYCDGEGNTQCYDCDGDGTIDCNTCERVR